MDRRAFLAAALAGVAGCAGGGSTGSDGNGSESGGTKKPPYGGWFEGVSNFDGTVDRTGRETVEVKVGAEGNGGPFAFAPAAVAVSPETTVRWRWVKQNAPPRRGGDGQLVRERTLEPQGSHVRTRLRGGGRLPLLLYAPPIEGDARRGSGRREVGRPPRATAAVRRSLTY